MTLAVITIKGHTMDNIDRYLKIVNWAGDRYRKRARLIFWEAGNPTKFTAIENAAWKKYM